MGVVWSARDAHARFLGSLYLQGLNAKLYYENDNYRQNLSLVPTSAWTGEGVPDLLMLTVQITQQLMTSKLMFMNWPEATVLEVKSIEGLGTTIDIVLVNGELKQTDTIVVCGMHGPIVTNIRALLTPKPMREIRVRADYVHHKAIEAAMGIKIAAPDLGSAVAGTQVLVLRDGDEVEELKEQVMQDLETLMGGLERVERGVSVQASTLGSLEALMEHLRTHDPPVPVAHVGLGPLHKKDVIVAAGMMEESPEFATILAFDVKVTREAREMAEEEGVNIFEADIIYHLTDSWEKFIDDITERRKRDSVRLYGVALACVVGVGGFRVTHRVFCVQAGEAVFPCICKIIPTAIFNKRDPIVLGVDVLEGSLRIGQPLCVVVPADDEDPGALPVVLQLGRVGSIEHNHTQLEIVRPGEPSVAVKIMPKEAHLMYGRHFDCTQPLVSRITRRSINLLKANFRDDMTDADWRCVIKLKTMLAVDAHANLMG